MATKEIEVDQILGKGTNKVVYTIKESNTIFTTDLPLSNLVIASIEPERDPNIRANIKQGIRLKKVFNEEYIKNNKYIKEVINELSLHQKYATNEPSLAPKLYSVTLKWFDQYIKNINVNDFLIDPYKYIFELLNKKYIDNRLNSSSGILEIYILEQRCGEGISKNSKIIINEDFFTLVSNLINNLSEIGQTLFTDFKPDNSCPLYDNDGKLINIIGLDLDAKFTYDYNDIQNDFKLVTGSEISIETIKQMCKDIMYLEYMFNLLIWGGLNRINIDKLIEKLENKFTSNKLLEIMSFICYLSISELEKFNNQQLEVEDEEDIRNFDVQDIRFKFPLIHYILDSYKFINKSIFKKNIIINNEVINKDNIKNWFINVPYTILYSIITNRLIPISVQILEPGQIFVEKSNLKEPILEKLNEREPGYDSDDDKFAYHGYGGYIRKKNKSKRRKLTKRKNNKKRFTKRRKH